MFNFIADKLNVKNLGEILAPLSSPQDQLFAASENGSEEKFLQILEESQLDIYTANSAGNLLIHVAAYNGRTRIIEILLERGMDVNITGPRGNIPLHLSASQDHEETVRFLIDRGANPALRNGSGRTPYDLAKSGVIRQFLLPLQFRHEDSTEAAKYLPQGITPSVDPFAVKPSVAPPPIGIPPHENFSFPHMQSDPPGNLYVTSAHSAIPRNTNKIAKMTRPIQADGFGSSVGNEELTAKFGNIKSVKITAPPPMGVMDSHPTSAIAGDGSNPYSANSANTITGGGYHGGSQFSRGAHSQFTIFNPSHAAQQKSSGMHLSTHAVVPDSAHAPPSMSNYPQNAAASMHDNANFEDEEGVDLTSAAKIVQ